MTDAFGSDQPARELAKLLRELRGDTPALELANRIKASQSTISRVERGKQLAKPELAIAWGRATSATPQQMVTIERLADEAEHQHIDWRRHYSKRSLASGQLTVARREADARHLRVWTPTTIPGPMQSAETATAIFDATWPGRSKERTRWLQARLARAAILHEPGRRLEYLIGEPALAWRTGRLYEHLHQLDLVQATIDPQRPYLRVGIVPLGYLGDDPIPYGVGFNLYAEMTSGRPVVHVEQGGNNFYGEDDLARYHAIFDQLAGVALYDAEAHALLEDIRQEATGS